MKVDFYISSLSSGGAEHVLTNLAADFAEHGMDVSVTSYEKRPQFYSVSPKVKLNKFDFTKKVNCWNGLVIFWGQLNI